MALTIETRSSILLVTIFWNVIKVIFVYDCLSRNVWKMCRALFHETRCIGSWNGTRMLDDEVQMKQKKQSQVGRVVKAPDLRSGLIHWDVGSNPTPGNANFIQVKNVTSWFNYKQEIEMCFSVFRILERSTKTKSIEFSTSEYVCF